MIVILHNPQDLFRKQNPAKNFVKIDSWDTYNLDSSLAKIISKSIEKLIEDIEGYPTLVSQEANAPEGLEGVDLWKWILNEMLFAMNEVAEGKPGHDKFFDHSCVDNRASLNEQVSQIKVDEEGLKAYEARVQNGCELLGKYFQSLWT
jgi:hypothetical protein